MNFKRTISYLLDRIYTNETIILYRIEKGIPHASKVQVKSVNSDNLSDIINFQESKYIKIFENFMSLGDCGYYAYIDNKCIHRSWVKKNEQTVNLHWAKPYQLKKDEVFIHYCETDPESRGQGVYPCVLDKIIQDNVGKEILISINKKNKPSIRGAEKVGFIERERTHIVIIIGIKQVKIKKL